MIQYIIPAQDYKEGQIECGQYKNNSRKYERKQVKIKKVKENVETRTEKYENQKTLEE